MATLEEYTKYLDEQNKARVQTSGLNALPRPFNAPESLVRIPSEFTVDDIRRLRQEQDIERQQQIQADNILKAEEYAKSKPGVLSSTALGLTSGLARTAQSVGTGLEYIGGKLGIEPVKKLGTETSKFWQETGKKYEAPQELQGSLVEKPELLKSGAWWGYNVAQMLPSFAVALVPGLGAQKYIKVAGKILPFTEKTMDRLATLGSMGLAGAVGGGLEGTSTYQEILQRGGTEADARSAMEQMTLASGALNTLSFGKILKKMPEGSKFVKAALNYLSKGTVESLTEWAEEPAEGIIKLRLGYYTPEQVKEQMLQGVNVIPPSFIMGMLGAGVVEYSGTGGGGKTSIDNIEEVPDDELNKSYKLHSSNLDILTRVIKKKDSAGKPISDRMKNDWVDRQMAVNSIKSEIDRREALKQEGASPLVNAKTGETVAGNINLIPDDELHRNLESHTKDLEDYIRMTRQVKGSSNVINKLNQTIKDKQDIVSTITAEINRRASVASTSSVSPLVNAKTGETVAENVNKPLNAEEIEAGVKPFVSKIRKHIVPKVSTAKGTMPQGKIRGNTAIEDLKQTVSDIKSDPEFNRNEPAFLQREELIDNKIKQLNDAVEEKNVKKSTYNAMVIYGAMNIGIGNNNRLQQVSLDNLQNIFSKFSDEDLIKYVNEMKTFQKSRGDWDEKHGFGMSIDGSEVSDANGEFDFALTEAIVKRKIVDRLGNTTKVSTVVKEEPQKQLVAPEGDKELQLIKEIEANILSEEPQNRNQYNIAWDELYDTLIKRGITPNITYNTQNNRIEIYNKTPIEAAKQKAIQKNIEKQKVAPVVPVTLEIKPSSAIEEAKQRVGIKPEITPIIPGEDISTIEKAKIRADIRKTYNSKGLGFAKQYYPNNGKPRNVYGRSVIVEFEANKIKKIAKIKREGKPMNPFEKEQFAAHVEWAEQHMEEMGFTDEEREIVKSKDYSPTEIDTIEGYIRKAQTAETTGKSEIVAQKEAGKAEIIPEGKYIADINTWTDTIHGSKYIDVKTPDGKIFQPRFRNSNHQSNGVKVSDITDKEGNVDPELADSWVKVAPDMYYEMGSFNILSDKVKNRNTIAKVINENPIIQKDMADYDAIGKKEAGEAEIPSGEIGIQEKAGGIGGEEWAAKFDKMYKIATDIEQKALNIVENKKYKLDDILSEEEFDFIYGTADVGLEKSLVNGNILKAKNKFEKILKDHPELQEFNQSKGLTDEKETETLDEEKPTLQGLFDLQNTTVEHKIPIEDGNADFFSEAAGDIFREMTKDKPDLRYINEKIKRLAEFNDMNDATIKQTENARILNKEFDAKINKFINSLKILKQSIAKVDVGDRQDIMDESINTIEKIVDWVYAPRSENNKNQVSRNISILSQAVDNYFKETEQVVTKKEEVVTKGTEENKGMTYSVTNISNGEYWEGNADNAADAYRHININKGDTTNLIFGRQSSVKEWNKAQVKTSIEEIVKGTIVTKEGTEPDEIFIRPLKTALERANPISVRNMSKIPDKEGYETVYKPYDKNGGKEGRGYYYVKKEQGIKQYSESETTVPQKGQITLAMIQSAFPTADNITQSGDTFFITKGNKVLAVSNVAEIEGDEYSLSVGYGDKKIETIRGVYEKRNIRISKYGDFWVLRHEQYHWLEDDGFITKSDQMILDKGLPADIKNSKLSAKEKRTMFVEDFLRTRAKHRNSIVMKVLQKIADFVDSLGALVGIRTVRGIVRDIETGQILNKEARTAQNKKLSQFSVEELHNWYYSQMQRVLENKLPNRGDVSGIRKMIQTWADKGEYKKDELDWVGLLTDESSPLAGEGIVNKGDVLKWLDENNVKVEEVKLGEYSNDENRIDIERVPSMDGSYYRYKLSVNWVGSGIYDTREEAMQAGKDVLKGRPSLTKFSDPSLNIPGGSNYREIFVTVTNSKAITPVWNKTNDNTWNGKVGTGQFKIEYMPSNGKYRLTSPGNLIDVFNNFKDAQDNAEQSGFAKQKASWQDGHTAYSDIINPIVRLRIDDRVDADGKKFLFIEEMQPPSKTEQEKMPAWAIKRWREIGAKRMLRYAAENGYSKIAWTTGEMQVERYNLSNQVKEIQVFRHDKDGTFDIATTTNEGSRHDIGMKVPVEKLSDYVDEDLAEKIANGMGEPSPRSANATGQWRNYSGLDLKIGGEGLKRIYDQDLPNVFNALSKKWGGKVGETKIVTDTAIPMTLGQYDLFKQWMKEKEYTEDVNEEWNGDGKRYDEYVRFINKNQKPIAKTIVHSIDVTDSMRESAMQGQPLFKAEPDDFFKQNITPPYWTYALFDTPDSMSGEMIKVGSDVFFIPETGEFLNQESQAKWEKEQNEAKSKVEKNNIERGRQTELLFSMKPQPDRARLEALKALDNILKKGKSEQKEKVEKKENIEVISNIPGYSSKLADNEGKKELHILGEFNNAQRDILLKYSGTKIGNTPEGYDTWLFTTSKDGKHAPNIGTQKIIEKELLQSEGRPIDRIIKQSSEVVKQDRPGASKTFMQKIPVLKQILQYERPSLEMVGEDEKIQISYVANQEARIDVAIRQLITRVPLIEQLDDAFGKDVVRGKSKSGIEFIGTTEEAESPLTMTLLDIVQNADLYKLNETQQSAIDAINKHNNASLDYVNNGYDTEIGHFKIKQGSAFLSNVDISEDVMDALGNESRAIKSGRGKTRIWDTARDRKGYDKTFEPELNIERLINGMDDFKASAAGGAVARQILDGKTRLDVIHETHPRLYEKMMSLRKRLQSLQGTVKRLNDNLKDKIDTIGDDFQHEIGLYLDSPYEISDITRIQDALDVKISRGKNAGLNIDVIQNEIDEVRAEIKRLKPFWEVANPKPYVFVQNGIYRYFPAKQAVLIKKQMKISDNKILRLMQNWKATAFGGDFSPVLGVQTPIGVLADPIGSFLVGKRGISRMITERNILRPFQLKELVKDISEDPNSWIKYFTLTGRVPVGTPEEFAGGFLSKIPGYNAFTEGTYIFVTRQSKYLFDKISKGLIDGGIPELEANVTAINAANEIYPLLSTTKLGQSQARAAFLQSLPTSYSFIRQPASMIASGLRGYVKLGIPKAKLTPKERVAVRLMTTMAISVLSTAAISAFISAVGDDRDKMKAVWNAINPSPYNSNFACIIIGKHRIPLGGPYRAIFRAIFPQKVSGIPIPVPFAGLFNYARNRINPLAGTQIDLIKNRDYYGQQILKGEFPERMLRFLEYELEGVMPLTLGTVAESVRKGDVGNEMAWQTVGQFVGTNVAKTNNIGMLHNQWRKDLKKYNDIPADPDEARSKKMIARSTYRRIHPDVDAKLFITGKIGTVSTGRAAAIAFKLIQENEIDYDMIKGIKTNKKEREKQKKLGVSIGRRTYTDALTDKLEKQQK